MLIENFDEFVKSIDEEASVDPVFKNEQEEEIIEDMPEELGGNPGDWVDIDPPEEEELGGLWLPEKELGGILPPDNDIFSW
jgi:hypothetical protein